MLSTLMLRRPTSTWAMYDQVMPLLSARSSRVMPARLRSSRRRLPKVRREVVGSLWVLATP